MFLRRTALLAGCLFVSALVAQVHPDPGRRVTTVRFDHPEHDFGWVLQRSENVHVFRFTNTGNEPLLIESARGSCGCTVPDFEKAPILPGAESEIRVVYRPGAQEGHQEKSVTVVANTIPSRTILRIHALVLTADPGKPADPYVFEPLPPEEEEPVHDPMPFGSDVFDPLSMPAAPLAEPVRPGPIASLRFDGMDHDFGQVLQGSENPHVFTFTNTGDVPLTISQAAGSCGCTIPFYARDPIPPGGESEIHVVYKPGTQQGHQSKTVTITANTDPPQTLLHITAEVLVVDSVKGTELFLREEAYEQERKAVEAVSPGCFVLFPNPTSKELRLDLKEHIGKSAGVRVHDTSGRELLRTSIGSINSGSSRLDVSSFPEGVYIATIQVEESKPMSQCFVVDR